MKTTHCKIKYLRISMRSKRRKRLHKSRKQSRTILPTDLQISPSIQPTDRTLLAPSKQSPTENVQTKELQTTCFRLLMRKIRILIRSLWEKIPQWLGWKLWKQSLPT